MFRNIAIIAHVDHGKTTLVDAMLHQCSAIASHSVVDDRIMDSMDLERERGITIASKNTAVRYGEVKINILDTPGHADFGGEVERVLGMVEAALLLVDASEGPLPQTRFVLDKAMKAGLKILVCINKIDRPDARIEEVMEEIYDLFIDLGAGDDQIEFPVLYACARDGVAHYEIGDPSTDLTPLLDTIVAQVPPPPEADADGEGRVLITNLDYDAYVGRLAIGRLFGGKFRRNTSVSVYTEEGRKRARVPLLYTWNGLKRMEVDEALPGDIIAVAGVDIVTVGDTIALGEAPPLPRVTVDEPTISMTFGINDGPMSGKSGKYLTSRQIGQRLERELLTNVSLRVVQPEGSDKFRVSGRGELQLAILVEQMRREGFELTVSRPEVVIKDVDGRSVEPYEMVTLDLPAEHVGTLTQKLAARKGEMRDLISDGSGRTRMVYRIPSRGLIGLRGEFLTDTRGQGVMNSLFDGWDDTIGRMLNRTRGAIIADRQGKATTYSLFNLQPRGDLFIGPGTDVYEGMIIGEHTRENDLNVNITKAKQLTNFRTVNADEKQILAPPRKLTLEMCMEFIEDDELVEITPAALRLRKRALKANQRSIIRRERP